MTGCGRPACPPRAAAWARIPRFHDSPYYGYHYASARYLTLLKSGGNDHPMKQLQKAGVDLAQRATVQAVVTQLDQLVSQMEAEAAKIQR